MDGVFELFSIRASHRFVAVEEVLGWHTCISRMAWSFCCWLFAGKSSKSTGAENDDQPRLSGFEAAAVVGPYIFIAGLLLLISALAEVVFPPRSHRRDPHPYYLLPCYRLPSVGSSRGESDINEFFLACVLSKPPGSLLLRSVEYSPPS